MEKTKKILRITGNVLIWLFVAFAVAITVLVFSSQSDADGVPSINGNCVINILTPSMNPFIKEGDIIIGKKLTDSEKVSLEVGDVVTFRSDLDGDGTDELNTHRIIEIIKGDNGTVLSYVTKGDNNLFEDRDSVRPGKVICKYSGTRLGSVGTFINFLQTSLGFFVVIIIPLAAFFIFELVKFIMTVNSVRGKNSKKLSEHEKEEIKKKAIEEYLKQQKEAEEKAAKEASEKQTETTETKDEE